MSDHEEPAEPGQYSDYPPGVVDDADTDPFPAGDDAPGEGDYLDNDAGYDDNGDPEVRDIDPVDGNAAFDEVAVGEDGGAQHEPLNEGDYPADDDDDDGGDDDGTYRTQHHDMAAGEDGDGAYSGGRVLHARGGYGGDDGAGGDNGDDAFPPGPAGDRSGAGLGTSSVPSSAASSIPAARASDSAAAGTATSAVVGEDVRDVVCELYFPSVDFVHTDTFPAAFSVSGLKASLARSFKAPLAAITIVFPLPAEADPESAAAAAAAAGGAGAGGIALDDSEVLGGVLALAEEAGLGHGVNDDGAAPIGSPARPLRLRVDIAALPDADAAIAGAAGNGLGASAGAQEQQQQQQSSSSSDGPSAGGDDDARSAVAPVDVIRVSLGPADPADPASAEVFVFVKMIKEYALRQKRFLGGFRNKVTGTVSHHAGTQTVRREKAASTVKFHRETQTQRWESRSVQTTREIGIQMSRKDLVVSSEHDTVLVPRPYFSAHQLTLLKHSKAIEVQCFLRMCFAARRVRRLQNAREEAHMTEIEARAREEEAKRQELARQARRRAHPRSKEDFETLHRELEAWRLHEVQRIKASGLPDDQVSFQLQEVLGKEVVVLQILDRLKLAAAKKNEVAHTQKVLEQMSSAKAWTVGEVDTVDVETPFTRRARELVVLYTGLTAATQTAAERADVLLHVKYAVKEFDCDLTREILSLITREEDMLQRGRSEQSLAGLRKRIANGFLQFINTPEFNPEAAAFVTAPQKPVEILTKPQRGPR